MAKEHTWKSALSTVAGKTMKAAGYTGLVLTGLSALLQVKITSDLTYTLDVPLNIEVDPNGVTATVDGSIGPAHMETHGDWGHGNYTNSGLLGGGEFNFGSWSGEFNLEEVLIDVTMQLLNNANIKVTDDLHMEGELNGTVLSFDSPSDLLNLGPAVLGSISLGLIASGHALDDVIAEKLKKTVPVQTEIVRSRRAGGSWQEQVAGNNMEMHNLIGSQSSSSDGSDSDLERGTSHQNQQNRRRQQQEGDGICVLM